MCAVQILVFLTSFWEHFLSEFALWMILIYMAWHWSTQLLLVEIDFYFFSTLPIIKPKGNYDSKIWEQESKGFL